MPTTDRVKRLSLILPADVADEICEEPTAAKAMLLLQTIDDVLEKMDRFPELLLSATTTQWLSSLSTIHQLQLIENLALMIMSELDVNG